MVQSMKFMCLHRDIFRSTFFITQQSIDSHISWMRRNFNGNVLCAIITEWTVVFNWCFIVTFLACVCHNKIKINGVRMRDCRKECARIYFVNRLKFLEEMAIPWQHQRWIKLCEIYEQSEKRWDEMRGEERRGERKVS